MKLLWVCNIAPKIVQKDISGQAGDGGLWLDHALHDVLALPDMTVHVLCRENRKTGGQVGNCSYATFVEVHPYPYSTELEEQFKEEISRFAPDVIHVWGTEYAHTLAVANACEALDMLDRLVISLQGLCSVIARHYAEGVPVKVQRSYTFRDFLRQDNIQQQQRKFAVRGDFEEKALRKARHVIGRTDWDKACTLRVNPGMRYHFCNETLREAFYEGDWDYNTCTKHRIFASSCAYSVKGFHYLLEAFADVLKVYPDATLTVTGGDPLQLRGMKDKLRQGSYARYIANLIRKYRLEGKVKFLGNLNAAEMKQAYLDANVFVLPSTIENSPNSLGEAMLLGVPCVASDVGGVTNLMRHNEEGFVYQSSAPYMLAHYIGRMFELGDCTDMRRAAKQHAQKTHDAAKNLEDLLNIYRELQSGAGV